MNTITRLRVLIVLSVTFLGPLAVAGTPDDWSKAERNAGQAREAFLHCRRFVDGWLAHADPKSGLIPRNLTRSPFWNAKDAAADNYPFMVLTTALTDRTLFQGRMLDMLRTEIRLTNRLDALPDDFLFSTQSFRTETADLRSLIFGASEYVKDGLIPLTEWLGPSPWSRRMISLVDDIWKHASTETPVGILPATDHEVCGELMQSISRIYWRTGDDRYREWAFRLADYSFLHHLPIEDKRLGLDDHGCEIIGGLSEVYFLAAHVDPARRDRYRQPMYRILDKVLEIGRNEHGLLFDAVNPRTGEVLGKGFTDNWGYNYNAFLTVAQLDNIPRYREAVVHVLRNIHRYADYQWEGGGSDGYADSIEGGINLLNRIPVPEAFDWVDVSTDIMLKKQRDDGIIEGWHGDGNYARTAIMYALWKTQGLSIEPWRADVAFGAVVDEEGVLKVFLRSDWPWSGKLKFDIPRHQVYLHLPHDYPRLNQFPEWFTVQEGVKYKVSIDGSDGVSRTGKKLHSGLSLELKQNTPVKITVRKM